MRYGGLPWMQGAFYGIGAAVIAIIARSAVKLVQADAWRRIGCSGRSSASSAVVTAWTESEIVWVFLGAGVVALVVQGAAAAPRRAGLLGVAPLAAWLRHRAARPGDAGDALAKIAWYFAEAGAFVFGSGLAIVPFLHGGVVEQLPLADRAAVPRCRRRRDDHARARSSSPSRSSAISSPGRSARRVAALGVFLPCYLFVVVPARYFRRFAKNPSSKAFVDGVTAAATGAIAGRRVRPGPAGHQSTYPTILIALGDARRAHPKVKKLPEPLVIVATGLAGFALKHGLGR